MCYSNSSTSSIQSLSKKYNRVVPEDLIVPTYYIVSGFAFPRLWCITKESSIQQMQWGLIPFWFKGYKESIAAKTLNARIETIKQKASFKHIIEKNHCVIPSNGFYEWHANDNEKIPFYIKPCKDELFSFAGIYDSWIDESNNNIINSFSIITTKANQLMTRIHNVKKRMPFILKQDKIEEWISGKFLDPVESSIKSEEMIAYQVDKNLVLNHNNLIETTKEIDRSKTTQLKLFQ